MTTSTPTPEPIPFREHFERTTRALGGALERALARAGADPNQPLLVAKQLGISKTLGWRASKIALCTNLGEYVRYMPAAAGMRTLAGALRERGVDEKTIHACRTAFRDYQEMVRTHGGDRSTFELLVGGLETESPNPELLEQNRKYIYRGMSGTLGLQLGLQFTTHVFAPSATVPDKVDSLRLMGRISMSRLRADVRWPMIRLSNWDSEGDVSQEGYPLPLSATRLPGQVPLLVPEFCSQGLPKLEESPLGNQVRYDLPPGEVGISAALDCVFGMVENEVGRIRAAEPGDFCRLSSILLLPAEHHLKDVFVHEDMGWVEKPSVELQSLLSSIEYEHSGDFQVSGETAGMPVKFTERIQDLGKGLGGVATSRYARYRELMTFAFEQVGWDPNDFRVYRFALGYPPIPAVSHVRFPLP